MSDYEDYILSLNPESHLPLEELSSSVLVDLGSGEGITGAHYDTIAQQPSIVIREDFSMQYDTIGTSEGTLVTPQQINSMIFWIEPTEINEFLFSFSNSGIANSLISFTIINNELIFTYNLGDLDTGIITNVGTKFCLGVVITDTFISIYKDGSFIQNLSIILITDLFDTFIFSEDLRNLLVDESANQLIDESGFSLVEGA